ncbi:aspartate kinase [Alkalihalobacillus alcalophilus ATCC 27647 = CGMCC 1.3604]|uniref:Aspartokinase n=1 Tax=Alkalihalobacillus alcalophilus ATCC 27647 = CGMCC 1.3604 TaxID=1218173 RepID=A0A094WH30_ALKAL|nr:aspartate kinase [Alkalihalobacillus alcalophilus]KGA97089.1 aspartate kinase [Alkalihalobacillus alcalophilus ATCC 27647 = CGMCC 1.3604]MED1563059.1 aspartate kinase [Alkalihalobacillus alcalophilus]THG88990.1 aspartate kinase [Alkalihalobacillus alcalophilus ATCC 27647 = CGMCC 1.3604]
MKVAKFGGSSVANANQIKKVAAIIQEDADRRIIVVSAPGKRDQDDTKVTDLLIDLADACLAGQNGERELTDVIIRYQSIAEELELNLQIIETIEADLRKRISHPKENQEQFMDLIKASGEDNNAKLIAAYLQSIGLHANYMNPKDAGLLVSEQPGNAQVLPEAYEHLKQLNDRDDIIVFPGFFGYSKSGTLCTFPRGGSDITGSILAAGVKADLYENFTDVDSVFAANPTVVKEPVKIKKMTYREMRELSYAGFSVFHDEALIPAFKNSIPVCIKNTNNPTSTGTMIIAEREYFLNPVIGIAADEGFSAIYVRKYLMNREVGFGRRLLQILEDECLSYEHIPSGIDDTTIILRQDQLNPENEERIVKRISAELDVDDVHIEHDFAMIMIVGEGMHNTIGLVARATAALANANVNIEMLNQGSSEVSLGLAVNEKDTKASIKALYDEFFGGVKEETVQ